MSEQQPGALWGGRFEGALAPEARAFTVSTSFDRRLVRQDCRVLAAHAGGLAGAGVLTREEANTLSQALILIAEDVESGAYEITEADEDIHSTVERALAERVPQAAGKVRAGLSRNDRVATAFRMWVRDATADLRRATVGLIGVLASRASEHQNDLMPGYTHLQRAQPVTAGYLLAAHASALRRDVERLDGVAARVAEMPLGAAALAGTTLAIDSGAVAESLGFSRRMTNTLDAVAARDFVAEFLAAAAILGVHLSRLGEEIVLWTGAEFGFAELSDAYATGSSMMPQKKNPDVAELVRGKSGRLIGDLAGFLATAKGLPLAYNRDLQEDKEPAFDAYDTLSAALPALTGALATLRLDTARMREAASDPLSLATDVAEYLVGKGVPFRDAHAAVGRAVAFSLREARDWRTMSVEDWRRFSPAVDEDVAVVLDAESSVGRRLPDIASGIDELTAWVAAQPQ